MWGGVRRRQRDPDGQQVGHDTLDGHLSPGVVAGGLLEALGVEKQRPISGKQGAGNHPENEKSDQDLYKREAVIAGAWFLQAIPVY